MSLIPRDAEDAHTAVFAFIVVVFAIVFVIVAFIVVVRCRGRRALGPRGHAMKTLTPPPLDVDDAPPPPPGMAGSHGDGQGIKGS